MLIFGFLRCRAAGNEEVVNKVWDAEVNIVPEVRQDFTRRGQGDDVLSRSNEGGPQNDTMRDLVVSI